jgi:DNA-directed RNA polymerase subunit RPC12/RpoP
MPGVVRLIRPNLKCRAILSVPATARGKSVRCKMCGSRITVPQAGPKPVKATPDHDESPPSA